MELPPAQRHVPLEADESQELTSITQSHKMSHTISLTQNLIIRERDSNLFYIMLFLFLYWPKSTLAEIYAGPNVHWSKRALAQT